jgi:alkanesulfonate monooxygenase SsuD/methylene tetrahydromethanopterin reductase-like flavin-dependent oxidoreductase (luciferase family)
VNIAHQTATVDQLSGGRLHLGVGAGSSNPEIIQEHENVGRPFDHRGERLNEALRLLSELWTGDSVDFTGNHYQVEDASIGFEPVTPPRIYVPTGSYDSTQGFPETIADRLQSVAGGSLPNVISPDRYRESKEEISSLLKSADRDPESFDYGLYLDVVVSQDRESALDQARSFYSAYYSDRADYSDEEILKRGAFGPIDHVEEVLDSYVSAGADSIVIRFVTTKQRANLAETGHFLSA